MSRGVPAHDVILDEAGVAACVAQMADALSSAIDDSWTAVVLLQGAMPFAMDLMRALAQRGAHPVLDCLWLESYRDARESSGKVVVRADLSRSVEGRSVLILDDVFDSGRTIAYARAHLLAKGAAQAQAAAFVRKPSAIGLPIEHVGFDAPDRFLIGYGMDDAGRFRGLPYLGALK